MILVLNVVFVLLGFLGAVAAVGVYALTQPWWRSQIGRFLVSQATVIAVVYFESILRVVFRVKFSPWVGFTTNATVAVLMLYHAWVFFRIVRANRAQRRAEVVPGDIAGR